MDDVVIKFEADEDGDCVVLLNGIETKIIFGVENIIDLLNTKTFTPNELGICPKCLSESQVWRNQITKKLTCHRIGCDNLELQLESEASDA